MDFGRSIPVQEIAAWINAELIGNAGLVLRGVNEIHKVREGDVMFVDHPKYFDVSLQSAASAIIVPTRVDCPPGKALLVVEHPFLAYELIVNRFRQNKPLSTDPVPERDIHPTAVIEPGAIVGQHVRIGQDCHIQAGAVIRPYSYLGDRVVIQSGAIIGSQAFYFKKWPDKLQGWTGCGRTIIGDDVWIGAGSTIASGVSGDTIIGDGTKIDCQVMIGHGAVIGKHCILAAQVGVAGKTIIGDWCILYGQVGVAQNLNIGDKTIILAQSGVTRDLEGGKTYFGSPAEEARGKYKEIAALRIMAGDYMKK